MGELTQRQVAVLRRARLAASGACTTYLTPAGMTVRQTGEVCRQLDRRGYMKRERQGGRMWRITSSGIQWLRSLDTGRPWMVRGYKRGAPSHG